MNCSVNDCERKADALGWCMKHYARWRRTGDANSPVKGTGGRKASNATCSVDTCDRLAHSKGWCEKHYLRYRRTGSPDVVRRVVSQDGPLATFWANVDKRGDDECWPWKRPPCKAGYGQLQWLDGTVWYAHRIAYVLAKGAVPESDDPEDPIEIDHECHTIACVARPCPHRLCCNAAHLVAKPRSANTARGHAFSRCPPGCPCGRHRGSIKF